MQNLENLDAFEILITQKTAKMPEGPFCQIGAHIFLRFCLCIFESDTVTSDCPVQIFRKMMKYLKITLIILLFYWRY